MPHASVNGIELYFEEHGVPSGTPLMLVHGYTGTVFAWERTLPTFAERYRVIGPELRGHGRSSGEPETIHHANFAAELCILPNAGHDVPSADESLFLTITPALPGTPRRGLTCASS